MYVVRLPHQGSNSQLRSAADSPRKTATSFLSLTLLRIFYKPPTNPPQTVIRRSRSNQSAKENEQARSCYPLAEAMACASLSKLNAASSQWIGQQSFTQRKGSSTRRVSVPIRAKAYTEELVETAVSHIIFLASNP